MSSRYPKTKFEGVAMYDPTRKTAPTESDIYAAAPSYGLQAYADQRRKQEEEYERRTKQQCSSCARQTNKALPCCSLCKSVWYCSVECQRQHYNARHKRECAKFARPPLTRSFFTEPLGACGYARHPVFGHSSRDGVGVWVSHDGRFGWRLRRLYDAMQSNLDMDLKEIACRKHVVAEDEAKGVGYNHMSENLLALAILVQNRRKDRQPILVSGAGAAVLPFDIAVDDILKGKGEKEKEIAINEEDPEAKLASIGVAYDPWDERPRLLIKNISGTEFTSANAAFPPTVMNAGGSGTVILRPGDYVVFHAEFRLGNGDTITNVVAALSRLRHLVLPWYTLDSSTVDDLINGTSRGPPVPDDIAKVQVQYVEFDRPTIRAYYDDLLEHGAEVFDESHYGKDYAVAMEDEEEKRRSFSIPALEALKADSRALEMLREHYERLGLQDHMAQLEERLRNM